MKNLVLMATMLAIILSSCDKDETTTSDVNSLIINGHETPMVGGNGFVLNYRPKAPFNPKMDNSYIDCCQNQKCFLIHLNPYIKIESGHNNYVLDFEGTYLTKDVNERGRCWIQMNQYINFGNYDEQEGKLEIYKKEKDNYEVKFNFSDGTNTVKGHYVGAIKVVNW